MTLLLLSLLGAEAALPAPATLTWDLSVAGQRVGERVLDVRYEPGAQAPLRAMTITTELDATVAGVSLAWKQRLTAYADAHPAAFHAIVLEQGRSREVQAAWRPSGWTLTTVEGPRARSAEVPGSRIDVSTVDLMDPGTRYPIERYSTLQVLSAETGEIWSGEVEVLGEKRFTIAGRAVDTVGYAWRSSQGPTRLYYDGEGYLVHYEMRLLGVEVAGTLRAPPPPGPDTFAVGVGSARVAIEEL